MKNRYEIRGRITVLFLKRKKGEDLATIIDTDDLEKVQEFEGSWYAWWNTCTQSFYCVGNKKLSNGKRTALYLHRFLTECPKGKQVDHVNHDTLDNRRSSNLRILTDAQNKQNKKGAQRNSTSGIRGVLWNKRTKKWYVQIGLSGKKIHFGHFSDIKEAERVAIEARKKYMPYAN